MVGLDELMSLEMMAGSTGSNRERRRWGGGGGSRGKERKGAGVGAAWSDTGNRELLMVVILSAKN